VERYVSDFGVGTAGLRRQEASPDPYFGIDLGPDGMCQLLGAWTAKYRSTSSG
jgi:hypothetical protein